MKFLERQDNPRPITGHILGMDEAGYNRDRGLRRTELMDWIKSPVFLIEDKPPTSSMNLGRDFHEFFLQPKLFQNNYAFEPELFSTAGFDRRKSENKAAVADFISKNIGKKILKHDVKLQFFAMRDSILAHPAARQLWEKASTVESTCFYDLIDGALAGKARLDIESEGADGEPVIVDLKTTVSCHPDEVAGQINRFDYHRQAAFYLDAYEKVKQSCSKFILVMVEKTEPFRTQVYLLSPEDIALGRALNSKSISEFLKWLEHREIHRYYSPDILVARLPEWAHAERGTGW